MLEMLKVGDKAPAFELEDQHGNRVSLGDFAGRKLLVYFFPRASTPGCTKLSCAVSDSLGPLKDAGVWVVGISPDPPEAQLQFDKQYNLGFPLLSDPQHMTASAYGAWGEKPMAGNPLVGLVRSIVGKKKMGIIRSAILIDEQGKLLAVAYNVSPADTVPLVWHTLNV